MKMTVNKPGDKHEQEADRTADRVMRMSSHDMVKVQKSSTSEREKVQRKGAAVEKEKIQRSDKKEKDNVQRKGAGVPVVSPDVASDIQRKKAGGKRMDASTRTFMESRFNADFRGVRIHHDGESARLSSQLGARAFTTGNHIFFGRDQYQPGSSDGKHLLAHELTHTIQQGAAIQRSAVVSTTATPPPIQRWGISDALDYFADKANYLPGFRLLTIVVGFNPVNMQSVDRSASNVLRALFEIIPGGTLVSSALERYGVFQRAGAWVEQQLAAFSNVGQQIRHGIDDFLASLSWRDVFDLAGVWSRAEAIFSRPISGLLSFCRNVAVSLLELVGSAVLRPLAVLVKDTRGYDLLCAVLGRDPITGDAVPRTAETLIGGFMRLIGREDIWENIKKGNAIGRAWQWFQGAISGIWEIVTSIPSRVIDTVRSISWEDIVPLTGLFGKVIRFFTGLAGRFFSFATSTVLELLEIIFSVVSPGLMAYLRRAAGAFRSILENPIGFVGNLVRAGRLGFEMFSRNIVRHLTTGLIRWITGPLGEAGVYIPTAFTLSEVLKLVLSVLGLTWQNIRSKLVRIIPEPVLVVLERSADILVTFVNQGPAAAWEQIKGELNELKSMMIAEITKLVSTEIVKAAVTKIVSMINPAGAVIQAIMAIYNTVMFFVERLSQIAQTVGAFVSSISAIAAGQVEAAAQRVEATMANTLTLIISFLARLVGLGGIPNKLVSIVRRIRAPIDRGLDRIVAWLGVMLARIGGAVKSGVNSLFQWWKKRVSFNAAGEQHSLYFEGSEESAEPTVASSPKRLEVFIAESRATPSLMADGKKSSALSKIEVDVPVLRGLRADLRRLKDEPDSKRQPLIDKLEKSMVKIGAQLGVVLSSSTAGTKANPILLKWPKPAFNNYPPINLYFTGTEASPSWKLSAKHLPERTLAATFSPDGKHKRYLDKPNIPARLSELGIKEPFKIKPDSVIGPLSEAHTPGGSALNSRLEAFGWNASEEYMDGDHVVEIQMGGKDELANLWPLDASINRKAGSTLSREMVELDGTRISIDWLKKVEKKNDEDKYYFRVRM